MAGKKKNSNKRRGTTGMVKRKTSAPVTTLAPPGRQAIDIQQNEQGERSIRIPLRMAKCLGAVICIIMVIMVAAVMEYQQAATTVSADKTEIDNLRQVYGFQVKQIEQLSKETTSLQHDMERLNMLDAEIRRIINSQDSMPAATSRAGIDRSAAIYTGQGGPTEVAPQLDRIAETIEELQAGIQVREQSLLDLRSQVIDRKERMSMTPSIWPADGQVTSRFGYRTNPVRGGSDWHPGIDVANAYGTPITATAAGTVIFSGWDSDGYGNMIQIDHGNGLVTVYAHNSRNIAVVGQKVKKGDIIAYMGSTGFSTGTHVHYEVRANGSPVNPERFLQ